MGLSKHDAEHKKMEVGKTTVFDSRYYVADPLFFKAIAKILDGSSNATCLTAGDSTTSGATGPKIKSKSFPSALAKALTAAGIQSSSNNSIFGSAGVASVAAYTAYNPYLGTPSAGWIQNSNTSLGGKIWSNSTDTGAWPFSPPEKFDTIDIWYFQNTGNGVFTVDVGGAVLSGGTINTAGVSALIKATVSTGAAAAIQTLNLKRSSGAVYIVGVDCYDSTAKSLRVFNAGWSSSTSIDWTNGGSAPYAPLNAIATIAPDILNINIGINDWNGGISVDDYLTNIQKIITAAKPTSAIILSGPMQSDPGTYASESRQNQFIDGLLSLAKTNQICFTNLTNLLGGSYVKANALGLMYDQRHGTDVCYALVANELMRMVIK